jgi:hypothetical protein
MIKTNNYLLVSLESGLEVDKLIAGTSDEFQLIVNSSENPPKTLNLPFIVLADVHMQIWV